MLSILRRHFCGPIILGLIIATAAQADAGACDTSGTAEARQARAATLAIRGFDVAALGCAASLYTALSEENATDLDAQLTAARALLIVVDQLRVLRAEDLMGVNQPVITALNEHAGQYTAVAARARKLAEDDARVVVHSAMAARDVDSAADIAGLERAIALDPAAEGGLAELVLGRIVYELPTFIGGDGARSIALLAQAHEVDPNNPRAIRYLAEAYDLEGEIGKARKTLRDFSAVEPVPGGEQALCDELRHAIGLATRFDDGDLVEELEGKRAAVQAAHPELLSRTGHAVGGHGGANPLTGE
jgi:tetratricopeptide (TPR) repeat protein